MCCVCKGGVPCGALGANVVYVVVNVVIVVVCVVICCCCNVVAHGDILRCLVEA